MAAYAYTAINADGLELRGQVQAPTLSAAREQPRGQGLLAELLQELPGGGAASVEAAGRSDSASGSKKGVKARSLQVFSRQFATMIDAGLNVVTALAILEEQTDDVRLGAVIGEVRADVE